MVKKCKIILAGLFILFTITAVTANTETDPEIGYKPIEVGLTGELITDQYQNTCAHLSLQATPYDNISYHTAKVTWDAGVYSFKKHAFKGNKTDFETYQGNSEFVVYIPPGQGIALEVILELTGKLEAASSFGINIVSSTPENETTKSNPEVFSLNKELVLTKPVMQESAIALPTEFALNQNHPNPFNAATIIQFALPADSKTRIKVYNVLGEEVRALVNGEISAGYHKVTWDGSDMQDNPVASGIYFVKMEAGDFSNIIRLVMIK